VVGVACRKGRCTSQRSRALLSNPKKPLPMVSIKYVCNGQMVCMHTSILVSFFSPMTLFLSDRRVFQHINTFTTAFGFYVVTWWRRPVARNFSCQHSSMNASEWSFDFCLFCFKEVCFPLKRAVVQELLQNCVTQCKNSWYISHTQAWQAVVSFLGQYAMNQYLLSNFFRA